MIRAALILAAVLAGPTHAQGRSDADAYFDALLYCLTVGSRVSSMVEVTNDAWLHEVDAATGLHRFSPPDNANTFVVMEPDDLDDPERTCDAVSLTIPTAEANLLLDDMILSNGFPYTAGAEDPLGCKAYLGTVGWVVSAFSGGDNPTCDDPAKSTIRVIRKY
ncbi:MAG: hypothetical protein ACRCS3_00805 [Paracoccaceae bacterium]